MALSQFRRRAARLFAAALETRDTPATFVVTGTTDAVDPLDGVLSFREALLEANASPDAANTISFNIPAGPFTIQPLTALPPVLKAGLVIDGLTQPGSTANTLATGGIDAVPLIELDGQLAPAGTDGLTLEGESVTVRGLVINRFALDGTTSLGGNGIHILATANKVVIAGNFLGTDAAGTAAAANGKRGVFVNGADSVTIGGANPADRNLISGNNERGIAIAGDASATRAAGNLIGTDKTGTVGVANTGGGVSHTSTGTDNLVGGPTVADRNVIAGNTGGTSVQVGAATNGGLTIQGNYIGIDATGFNSLPNGNNSVFLEQTSKGTKVLGNAFGQTNTANVFLDFSSDNVIAGNTFGLSPATDSFIGGAGFTQILITNGSDNNLVGGPTAADRNTIAGDIGGGFNYSVSVRSSTTVAEKISENNTIQGNWIGLNKAGTVAFRNSGQAVEVSEKAFGTRILNNVIAGAKSNSIQVTNQSGATVVQGNQIGMLADGVTKSDTVTFSTGINVSNGAIGTVIGGATADERNVIAGAISTGIGVGGGGMPGPSTGTQVLGNWIGLSKDGTVKVGVTGQGISLSGNTTGTIVRGNHVSGATEGINANNSNENVIAGNTIGVNLAGDSTAGFNNTSHAVQIQGTSAKNVIGGPDPADRNFLTGSTTGFRHGVNITGAAVTDTLVQNNYISVTKDGNASTGNTSRGIQVSNFAKGTVIVGNLISGTGNDGVNIENSPNTVVRGNIIGLNAAGTASVKNNTTGISISGFSTDVVIGGPTAADRNVISGNNGTAVIVNSYEVKNLLIQGNWIGLGSDGQTKIANTNGVNLTITIGAKVIGNVISGNTGTGISLNGTNGVIVQGNLIGGSADGKGVVPNGSQGISLGTGTVGSVIGGSEPGQGNRIVGSGSHGIQIVNESNLAFTEFKSNAQDGVTDRYYYITPLSYWKALEAAAATIGGHLVAIDNQAEQDFIQTTVMPTFANTSYAIGATDDPFYGTTLKTYIWTDPLSPFIYTNWNTGEPNNGIGGSENYGEIIGNSTTTFGKWNDFNASGLRRGILEFAVQPTPAELDSIRPLIQNQKNVVQGNVIGQLADGTAAGNGGAGVRIDSAIQNVIGGVKAGEGNVIVNSKADGVQVVGAAAFGNTIRGNSIDTSGNLGIDLADNGVTPNDPQDPDVGPNLLQNYPVLTLAKAGAATQVDGTLDSLPDTEFTLDFYSAAVKNSTGHGEGGVYLGSTTVKTDAGGLATFSATALAVSKGGAFITATATDPAGNTSEFALSVEAEGGTVTPAAKVSSLAINGTDPQRSMVTKLTVTFDQVVTLPTNAADAFTLTGSKGAVTLAAAVSGGTATVVDLTFSGTDIIGGSLYDGKFSLVIAAAQVNGGNFDGNGDGTAGDDFTSPGYGSPGPNAGTVFRLFGDGDGNGSVNFNDFLAFRTTFGLKTADAGFNAAFDFDANGSVDFNDFLSFRSRFGTMTP